MSTTYEPKEIEKHIYKAWEKHKAFEAHGNGKSYSIAFPPPNVTGSLHMGHAFQTTLMDALVRYHRMLGEDTHWQVGTDHAGIATQMVVERDLNKEGKSRLDMGREKFTEKVWEWKENYGQRITQQIRRLGASVDWERERFSMDEGLNKAVKTVFISLFNEGLIYRGQRLVNWDSKFHTAISDLEVISKEEQGSMWHFRYPIKDSNESLIIATTRPETMLGDVAVAVHPEDTRYQKYIGKRVQLPLCDRDIPIIADNYVDPEFKTGCVKITPAHDFNDYDIGKRHNLEMINILNEDATLNENVPNAYQGKTREDARKQIVKDMEAQGLLVEIEDYTLSVPRGDRSGVVIEPRLTYQWFVKAKPLADKAIDIVKMGKIELVPNNWEKTYYQWLENIQDWCISRQLWWGHRIPAWFDADGHVYVGEDEADVRQSNKLSDSIVLTQDEDVLDTWFSASLWPFATLGWPENTDYYQRYYPTSVLVTGFDIIFFWVARMVMMGLKFTDQIPFQQVYITGLIRDSHGQKMSKTKGNSLDPIDLIDGIDLETLVKKRTHNLMQPHLKEKIEKQTRKEFPEGIPMYGTDAVRFTLCSLANTGRDINFDLNRTMGYRNFCNKLWNASRYVLMTCDDVDFSKTSTDYVLPDLWILTKLQKTIDATHKAFKDYRFDLLSQGLYEFLWDDFCDWYLECSKVILQSDTFTAEQKNTTKQTLLNVLETALRLLHPLMPYITEEIWKKVSDKMGINENLLMLQAFPQSDTKNCFEKPAEDMVWLQRFITCVRTMRAENQISPAKMVPLILQNGSNVDKTRVEQLTPLITAIAKAESITWDTDQSSLSATGILDELDILIPLAGLIDIDSEKKRLEKDIVKIEKELSRLHQKLSNPNFIDKAPQPVVEKEKSQQAEYQKSLLRLQEKLKQLIENANV